jgi:hypothetical protein
MKIEVKIINITKKAITLLETGSSRNFILQKAATKMEKENMKGIQITGLNNTKEGESSQVDTIRKINKEKRERDLTIKG